ncbi:hypothetical protein SAMN05446037_1006116 [Anaerovirgula multivorans]|uniref:Uncharacterized protein n=1 Tax=Anaerovirgula multivorans TaxID=312168 RepID=A0A239CR81_9FIRM|nr:hypothetical protein SAMN05446037_1006116 [Anaerovirgula multivorans]
MPSFLAEVASVVVLYALEIDHKQRLIPIQAPTETLCKTHLENRMGHFPYTLLNTQVFGSWDEYNYMFGGI